jgi:hypothetical protein
VLTICLGCLTDEVCQANNNNEKCDDVTHLCVPAWVEDARGAIASGDPAGGIAGDVGDNLKSDNTTIDGDTIVTLADLVNDLLDLRDGNRSSINSHFHF